MYSNEQAIEMFEQMVAMGAYYSSGRPIYVEPRIIIDDICSKIPLSKDDIILDVGCGTGLLTIPFAKKCKHVYALDAGEKVIEKLKENCKKAGISNVKFFKGLATELPFKGQFFDKVIMYAVMHYLENEQQIETCIRESIRVCKVNGSILIAEIPLKGAREEFDSREKTSEELKILGDFENNRKQYDKLFNEKVIVKTERSDLIVDENFLLEIIQKEGYSAEICKQDIRQPLSLTRKDLVISLSRS